MNRAREGRLRDSFPTKSNGDSLSNPDTPFPGVPVGGEDRFHQFLSLMPAAVYTCDALGRITYFNPRAVELWGREPTLNDFDERFCGSFQLWRLDGEPMPHSQTPMALAVRNGRTARDEEVIIQRPDGSRIVVSVNVEVLRDASGERCGAINVFQDITERKRTNKALRESEERFRILASQAPVGIFMSDPDGASVFVNETWCRMTGLTEAQARGHGWLEALHPDDRERISSGWKAAVRRGGTSSVEFRFLRANGGIVWVHANSVPLRDADQVLTGYIGTITDITERKQAARLLRESERRFRHMADHAPVLIWMADTSRRCAWLNQRWLDFVGRTLEQETGEGWTENLHPEDLMRCLSVFVEAFNGRRSFEMEYRLRRHDGEYRWILHYGVPMYEESGDFSGYIGSGIDITDRLEIENLLRRQAIMLEQTYDAIFAWELDGGITYWGQGAERLYGFTSKQAVGQVSHRLLSTQHPDGMESLHAALEREGQWTGELTHRSRAGVALTVESKLVLTRQPDGRILILQTNHNVTERRLAERALRESEERFRVLADNIPVMSWTADKLGSATWYNRRWHDYTGTDFREMKERGWEKLHHPAHIDRVKVKLEQCLKKGEVWEDTFPLLGKDGAYRWFLSRTIPIRDSQGNIQQWFGTNTDVTDLRIVQEALQRRTLILEIINRVSAALVAELDTGKIVQLVTDAGREISGAAFGAFFYNAKGERDEGYTLYKLSGAPREAFSNFPVPRKTELFGPTFRGEGVVRIGDVPRDPRYGGNAPYRGMPEGHLPVRSYLAVPVMSRPKEVLGGLFFGHPEPDIFTQDSEDVLVALAAQAALAIENANLYAALQRELEQQKRSEVALRESESRFRQLADALPQIVWTATGEGRTDYFNRQWYELTGADPGSADSQSLYQYLHPDDRQQVIETWNASVRSGEPYEIEHRLKFPSQKEYRWLLGRAVPVHDTIGKIVRWFGTCTDIDEMKRAEETLEQAVASRTAELRQINDQLESFVYSIAHDLRTPLRAVEALSKMLLDDYGANLDTTGLDFARRINQSAEFMDRLLLDLLDYGRTARAEVEMGPVSVKSAWETALFQCQLQIEERFARVDVTSPLPVVRANEAILAQVLTNLLSNALRFVKDGVQPHIRLSTEDRGDKIRLCLQDNGIGIKPEHQERIFRVFERLHGSNYGGTGIGLAIVRQGSQRMGGKVGVQSIPGQGSCFWVELPAIRDVKSL